MVDEIHMSINLPIDEEGMLGRQCPLCDTYFKIRLGTGIPDIETVACPYCGHQADFGEFHTPAQIEYATSIAVKRTVGPALRKLARSLKGLERSSHGSMIQFKVKSSGFNLPVKYYSETDLETNVECDSCGLQFAVYGGFAVCPDCLRPNSMKMFSKSLDAARKRLALLDNIPTEDTELNEAILIDSISAAVSTFDSLGKRLRQEFPEALPSVPRNLFQNLQALEEALRNSVGITLQTMISESDYSMLNYMFQVRHIWTHNFGEADQEFINKTNSPKSLLGERISPSRKDVEKLFGVVEEIGVNVRKELGDSA